MTDLDAAYDDCAHKDYLWDDLAESGGHRVTDVNVDPTEQLLARADEMANYQANSELVHDLAAVLRATRTELASQKAIAEQTYHDFGVKLQAAEATLQQARQLAREWQDVPENQRWILAGELAACVLKDEP